MTETPEGRTLRHGSLLAPDADAGRASTIRARPTRPKIGPATLDTSGAMANQEVSPDATRA